MRGCRAVFWGGLFAILLTGEAAAQSAVGPGNSNMVRGLLQLLQLLYESIMPFAWGLFRAFVSPVLQIGGAISFLVLLWRGSQMLFSFGETAREDLAKLKYDILGLTVLVAIASSPSTAQNVVQGAIYQPLMSFAMGTVAKLGGNANCQVSGVSDETERSFLCISEGIVTNLSIGLVAAGIVINLPFDTVTCSSGEGSVIGSVTGFKIPCNEQIVFILVKVLTAFLYVVVSGFVAVAMTLYLGILIFRSSLLIMFAPYCLFALVAKPFRAIAVNFGWAMLNNVLLLLTWGAVTQLVVGVIGKAVATDLGQRGIGGLINANNTLNINNFIAGMSNGTAGSVLVFGWGNSTPIVIIGATIFFYLCMNMATEIVSMMTSGANAGVAKAGALIGATIQTIGSLTTAAGSLAVAAAMFQQNASRGGVGDGLSGAIAGGTVGGLLGGDARDSGTLRAGDFGAGPADGFGSGGGTGGGGPANDDGPPGGGGDGGPQPSDPGSGGGGERAAAPEGGRPRGTGDRAQQFERTTFGEGDTVRQAATVTNSGTPDARSAMAQWENRPREGGGDRTQVARLVGTAVKGAGAVLDTAGEAAGVINEVGRAPV